MVLSWGGVYRQVWLPRAIVGPNVQVNAPVGPDGAAFPPGQYNDDDDGDPFSDSKPHHSTSVVYRPETWVARGRGLGSFGGLPRR